MEVILDFAKTLLLPHLHKEGVYVDFTMGNGFDTLFLAKHTSALVYSFDIQQIAVDRTESLLKQHQISNVKLILDSHANVKDYLPGPIDAGIFNLGYLPNGNKSITTEGTSSLKAVQIAIESLSDRGIIVIVLYPGHPQGRIESEMIEGYCCQLSGSHYNVLKYDFINKKYPPYLIAIERKQK